MAGLVVVNASGQSAEDFANLSALLRNPPDYIPGRLTVEKHQTNDLLKSIISCN